ncbi:MAG: hypothetical protein ACK559_04855, partial [bacterium]
MLAAAEGHVAPGHHRPVGLQGGERKLVRRDRRNTAGQLRRDRAAVTASSDLSPSDHRAVGLQCGKCFQGGV